MNPVNQLHGSLLRRRTSIRHHKNTLQWMKRCWRAVPHDNSELLSLDEYEVIYSTLLYEMTICWEDETSDIILAKMWQRDVSSFENLDYDRFCCSLFRYIEMWADDVTQQAYDRVFGLVYAILVGTNDSIGSQCISSTIKPTLESVNSLIDHEKRMDELNLSLGKSILFNASEYVRLYGAPPSVTIASGEESVTSQFTRSSDTSSDRFSRIHRPVSSPTKSLGTAQPSTSPTSRRATYRTSETHHALKEQTSDDELQLAGQAVSKGPNSNR